MKNKKLYGISFLLLLLFSLFVKHLDSKVVLKEENREQQLTHALSVVEMRNQRLLPDISNPDDDDDDVFSSNRQIDGIIIII